jgi:hypothetical protein
VPVAVLAGVLEAIGFAPWPRTSRSGRTSWRWCRCCSSGCGVWISAGRPGWAAQRSGELDLAGLLDRGLLAAYRRQQELAWIEQLVEEIQAPWRRAVGWAGPGGSRPWCSWTWWAPPADRGPGRPGRGRLAETLAVLVDRSSREHGGRPVKWLGGGVMVHFPDPPGRWGRPWTWSPSCRRLGCRRPMSGWRPGRWSSRVGITWPDGEPGRSDRRPGQRRSGPGQPAGGRAAASGGALGRAGAGAAGRHHPASPAAGGPPDLTPHAPGGLGHAHPTQQTQQRPPRPATTHEPLI